MLACKLEKPSNEGCVLPFPFASNDGRPSNKIRQHNGSPVGSDLSRPGAGAGRRCCNSCSLFWLRAQRARRSLQGLQVPPIFSMLGEDRINTHHVLIGPRFPVSSHTVTRGRQVAWAPRGSHEHHAWGLGCCRPVVRRLSTQLGSLLNMTDFNNIQSMRKGLAIFALKLVETGTARFKGEGSSGSPRKERMSCVPIFCQIIIGSSLKLGPFKGKRKATNHSGGSVVLNRSTLPRLVLPAALRQHVVDPEVTWAPCLFVCVYSLQFDAP